jgi:hypothetical protein
MPGLMPWIQHRVAQLTLGISTNMKVKMKLKMKKLQSKMQQMNAYSGLLQG